MSHNLVRNWMWLEACETLIRAERLRRAFFRPGRSVSRLPSWEPPIDVLETEREILILVALPGVREDSIEVSSEADELVLAGIRALPAELRTAIIHRMEIPQGRFERRVQLPPGEYSGVRHLIANGCLFVAIEKGDASRG
jgi:HSP20 family protein